MKKTNQSRLFLTGSAMQIISDSSSPKTTTTTLMVITSITPMPQVPEGRDRKRREWKWIGYDSKDPFDPTRPF